MPLGGGGYLVLKRPWPAMLRGIYGDPERYKQTYWSRFPGMYFAGDGAKRDEDGYFWLLGRVDDVMNVSGHRLSTTEIESALVSHPAVAEAAVVGGPDPVTGEAINCFVILRKGIEPTDALAKELQDHVATKISPIAKPEVADVHAGPAQDPLRQDHAPPPARHRAGPRRSATPPPSPTPASSRRSASTPASPRSRGAAIRAPVPPPLAAVVLDVGETLVDETRTWSVWADHLGVPRLTFFAALGGFIARGGDHREPFELFRPGLDLVAEVERLKADGRSPAIVPEDLYPDAIDALRALRRAGYRLGIAANQPTETASVIRGLGIELELVAMSAEWGLHKPSPAFFERICTQLDLPPAAIAYVGDRLDNDVRPARAAGMTAVWIRRGPWAWIQGGRDAPPEASLVVDDLASLPDALAGAGFEPNR